MDGPEDLALLVYDPIREGGETVMQAPPERDPVGRRGRNGDRAQPRNMFMVHLAPLRGESESGSPAARRGFRGSERTSRSGVLSQIILLREKPRHYRELPHDYPR
jgi:hypothetical protein